MVNNAHSSRYRRAVKSVSDALVDAYLDFEHDGAWGSSAELYGYGWESPKSKKPADAPLRRLRADAPTRILARPGQGTHI